MKHDEQYHNDHHQNPIHNHVNRIDCENEDHYIVKEKNIYSERRAAKAKQL